jgi:hypothetical protein
MKVWEFSEPILLLRIVPGMTSVRRYTASARMLAMLCQTMTPTIRRSAQSVPMPSEIRRPMVQFIVGS